MISVCMPYWRRPEALAFLLRELEEAELATRFEVVVADDGTPEKDLQAMEGVAAAGTLSFPVRVLSLPVKTAPKNPCVPINAAVDEACYSIRVLTNPETQGLAQVLRWAARMSYYVGAHHMEMTYWAARCVDPRGREVAGPTVVSGRQGRLPVPPGALLPFAAVFSRILWKRTGGYDEAYREGQACEDNDWLWRCHREGARFRSIPEVTVVHPPSTTRWHLPHNRDLFWQKWDSSITQRE